MLGDVGGRGGDAAEDAEANKMSEKEVMLELSKSIEKLTHSGEGVSGFFDAFKKGFGKGFAQGEGFKDLMNAIRKSLQVVFKFGKKFGKMISDLFGKLGLWKSLKKIFDPALIAGVDIVHVALDGEHVQGLNQDW